MARTEEGAGGRMVIEAAAFAKALAVAAGVTESRNTIPILANLCLRAEGETVEIVSTDLDIEYRHRVPLAAPMEGRLITTIDAKRMAALAGAAAPGAQLSIEMEGAVRAIVKAGRSRWVLPTLPADDFPLVVASPADARMTVAAPALLAGAIKRVMWSVSTEVTRYYLNGPLFHGDSGKLRLVSTNGNTLMLVGLDIDWPEGAPEVILGAKFCRLLESLTRAAAAPLTLAWDGRRMVAEMGDVTLTGKVIDGSFPDYRRVIPAQQDAPIVFDPADLVPAIRRVQLISSEKTRSIAINPETGKLLISATDPGGGTAEEELSAQAEQAFQRGFNGAFVLAAVDALGGDTVELHHSDAGAPALFRRSVDDGARCVVMPMRV